MTDREKEVYIQGYADAMQEHKLFVENLIEYINQYNYKNAQEQSKYKTIKENKI